MTSRCHGTVLDYDENRGYGRIEDDRQIVYFVHFRDIIGAQSLQQGQNVEFEAVPHRKGNFAREVSPV